MVRSINCIGLSAILLWLFVAATAAADDLGVKSIFRPEANQDEIIVESADESATEIALGERIELDGFGDFTFSQYSILNSYLGLGNSKYNDVIVLECSILNRLHETMLLDGLVDGCQAVDAP